MQTEIRDWAEVFWVSLPEVLGMFVEEIPKIIGFIIIFIIVWFVSSLVEKGVAALFRTVKFNDLATRSGFGDFVSRMSAKANSAGIIALMMLVAAINSFGLPAVSDILSQLLPELPNLVEVIVVLVLGGLAAGALSSLVHGAASDAELGNPDMLATITNVTVWAVIIVFAINQVGIAITFAGAFIGMIGALVLAFGLAFGFSKGETVKILRSWYEKGKQAIPRMNEATQDVTGQEQQRNRQSMQPPR